MDKPWLALKRRPWVHLDKELLYSALLTLYYSNRTNDNIEELIRLMIELELRIIETGGGR